MANGRDSVGLHTQPFVNDLVNMDQVDAVQISKLASNCTRDTARIIKEDYNEDNNLGMISSA